MPKYQSYTDEYFLDVNDSRLLKMIDNIDALGGTNTGEGLRKAKFLLDEGNIADINVAFGRQAYLMQIEGFSTVNEIAVKEKDAIEIIEDNIHIEATHTSHFIVIDMPKSSHPYM